MTNIGFLGLGIMGAPMAGHLLDGGHKIATAVHRSQPAQELMDKGLSVLGSAKEVAAASDVIILMLPDTPQVKAVLFGENGVAEGLSSGKTVIDMSSISPLETKEFANKINE